MVATASIFLDLNVPNATTWFYLALLLAVGLFFKFSRLLSMRNWDVVALFLLVPGLLLRQEARTEPPAPPSGDAVQPAEGAAPVSDYSDRLMWFAYLWLLCGSGYFLVRCLADLALERRPALAPNLNLGGLAWLAGALFICLVAVSIRRLPETQEKVGRHPLALEQAREQAEKLMVDTGVHVFPDLDAQMWVERILAFLCHLAIASALVVIGYRHFQDTHAGMAAATFYLLLPYTAMHFEQWHHVWPMALLLWAIACYRMPTVAGFLLGVAAGSVYFPVVIFPVWLSFYWRRGAARFTAAFLLAIGLCMGLVGLVLWLDSQQVAPYLQSAMNLSDWQPWRVPTTEGFWTGVHWAYRIPVFIAYVAFLLTTVFWPAPKNLAHLIALSAALLIGIQFWFSYQGGVYVLWYLPLLLLMAFRPNLADRLPPPITPENDWLAYLRQRLQRRIRRLLHLPEPVSNPA